MDTSSAISNSLTLTVETLYLGVEGSRQLAGLKEIGNRDNLSRGNRGIKVQSGSSQPGDGKFASKTHRFLLAFNDLFSRIFFVDQPLPPPALY